MPRRAYAGQETQGPHQQVRGQRPGPRAPPASRPLADQVNKNYGAMVADLKPHPAGFRLMLGLKDVELVLGVADLAKSPMPTASLLRDRFLSAAAKGRGDFDWPTIALGVAEDAGINIASGS